MSYNTPMSDRRRSPTLLAVLVLICLVLLTMDYRQGRSGFVAAVQRGALTVFAPVQDGLATVLRPLGDVTGSVGDLLSLREDNDELRAEVERLRSERLSERDLRRENAELRELLAMRDRFDFETVGAHAIAGPPGSFEWSVLIDAGRRDGVETGMAVINADGLVGKVVQVTARNARVQLLTSPDAGYIVRIADSGEEGMLSGRGSEPFQLEVLDPEARVEAGSELVTRAFEGSTVPDGIPVGVLAEPRDRAGGNRFLSVRPYVDFTRLGFVQVVTDAPTAPGNPLPDEEGRPGDGRGGAG